ncbi:MAG: hypothetical protein A2Z34_10210 [Planctomycetes bacterium RBG_16_59_8]|nr:MAG: hypothetical protein A2Z34_10210 [Planctomycetes bacterium RBG_16_59_8]
MRKFARLFGVLLAIILIGSCGKASTSSPSGGGESAPALTVTTTSLPVGTQGSPYLATLTATSGTTPYTWSIAVGSLPQGLSLSATGVISGTPTVPTNSSFTVQVGDSAAPQNTDQRILIITINALPLVITNSSLSSGNVTVPYTQQLQATGGVQPYSWSSTALPAGLTMSSTGLITGTPTTGGTTNITFTVTDNVGTSTDEILSITINSVATVTLSGTMTFDKVPIDASGLDLAGIFQSPIRFCYVGLEDQSAPGVFFSATYTDASGNYSLPSHQNTNVKIYIYSFSAHQAGSINVVDRASVSTPKATWVIATPNIPVTTVDITGSDWNAPDSTRINGAFNVTDVVLAIQQIVLGLNAASNFGDATIEFSPNFYSGTYFSGPTGFIMGDRATDSDDFDDPVIAHEYSHYLQTKFSRDDSTGGDHSANQFLDPRVAFGEGQATFMGQSFLGSPLYIDTSSGGASETDVESVTTTLPGYWSENSVMAVLWDCFDSTNEAGDSLALPFSTYWTVFTQDMQNHTLVYLIDFMDSLYARSPASGAAIASILAMESITYTPGGAPSVPNPWPDFLPSGVPVSSTVDASVDQQWNLMSATDVFYFTIPAGQSVTVTLTWTGQGPSPAAPDYVDFFVFNDTGHSFPPDGKLLYASAAPAGTGYTHSKTFTLPAAGTYSVVATACRLYEPVFGLEPTIFSSADYQITATY